MLMTGRQAGRRHARAVPLIPLLHVVLVRHGLLGVHGHVGRHTIPPRHVRVLGDAWAATLGREVLGSRLFGRFDLVAIHTVFVARRGLRSVEAGLWEDGNVSLG